ncbi:MAG TPA: hypothetical protein VGM39_23095 [Kofleriaceae bacterium]|jgi:hypothetical protein
MRRHLGGCAALLAACSSPSPIVATPHTPAPPPTVTAPAAPSADLSIRAQQVPEGLRVTYKLAHPIHELHFAQQAGPARAESWRIITRGVALDGETLKIAAPDGLRELVLLLTPDKGEYNRVYPSLVDMGPHAVMLYTRQLLGVGFEHVEMTLQASEGGNVVTSFHAAVPALTFAPDGDKGHYVYFGPAKPATIVGAPAVPEALATKLRSIADRGVEFYAQKLGEQLRTKPVVFVSYTDVDSNHTSFRGDVASNGEISLRFHGKGWMNGSTDESESRFLLHELVHLWNGNRYRPPGEGDAWLHEGSAEYFSLLAARELSVITPAQFDDAIAHAVNDCIENLGADRLGDEKARGAGRVIYTCGVTAEWFADLAARPEGDVFAIWRNVFADARKAGDAAMTRDESLPGARDDIGNPYTVDMFLARTRELAKTPAATALIDFLFVDPARDWSRLPALLKPLGVKLVDDRSPAWGEALRMNVLQHLLKESCKGNFGFFKFPDHVELDTEDRCGPLSGNPMVTRAEGIDLFKAPEKARAAVAKKCAKSGSVALQGATGAAIKAPCSQPLEPMPRMYAIGG